MSSVVPGPDFETRTSNFTFLEQHDIIKKKKMKIQSIVTITVSNYEWIRVNMD